MAQIANLLSGAGLQTIVPGLTQLDQFLTIGDVDTANPLQGFQVEVDGVTFINIQSASLITAFMKWQMETNAANGPGNMLKVATGRVPFKTNLRFTNAGATTPIIYASSEGGQKGTPREGVPLVVGTTTINATSYQDFEKFSALFLQTPTNVASVEIEYANGHRDTLAIQELDSLFSLRNSTDADGRLGGVSVIDNTDQIIKRVRINTNSVGSLPVMLVKLPQESFDLAKAMAQG